MKNRQIIDCHCHFVTLEDFKTYQKTSCANKFINIRSINYGVLVKPYDFETFKDIDNMYLTEAVDLYNLEEELTRVEKNITNNYKIIGIKIFLGYQPFYANDDKIKKVTQLANKHGISMIFHCGECYASDGKVDYSNAKYIENLALEFRDVNFIASHMNWPEFDSVFSLCEKYDNVYTCISGCLDAEEKEERENQVNKVTNIINKYVKIYPKMKMKLMYGTDFFPGNEAFKDVSDYIIIVNRLELNEKEKENVINQNILSAYKKIK